MQTSEHGFRKRHLDFRVPKLHTTFKTEDFEHRNFDFATEQGHDDRNDSVNGCSGRELGVNLDVSSNVFISTRKQALESL